MCHRGIYGSEDMTTRESDKFMMRLPDGWRERIKEEARKNHRTMNAEIISAIEVAMRVKGVQLDAAS